MHGNESTVDSVDIQRELRSMHSQKPSAVKFSAKAMTGKMQPTPPRQGKRGESNNHSGVGIGDEESTNKVGSDNKFGRRHRSRFSGNRAGRRRSGREEGTEDRAADEESAFRERNGEREDEGSWSSDEDEDNRPGAVRVSGIYGRDDDDASGGFSAAYATSSTPTAAGHDEEDVAVATTFATSVENQGRGHEEGGESLPVAMEAEIVELPPLVTATEHKESGIYEIVSKNSKYRFLLCTVVLFVVAAIGTAVGVVLAFSTNGSRSGGSGLGTYDEERQVELDILSNMGYSYTWSSGTGFLSYQPYSKSRRDFITHNVSSLVECARICRNATSISGSYNRDGEHACSCIFRFVCLEPCIVTTSGIDDGREEEEVVENPYNNAIFLAGGIEFSSRPKSDLRSCDKSYCDDDFFGVEEETFCDSVSYNQTHCDAKLNAGETSNVWNNTPTTSKEGEEATVVAPVLREDFSQYGYDYTWDARDGWFVVPPELIGNDRTKQDNYEIGVVSAGDCAEFCGNQAALGGIWNSIAEVCTCSYILSCTEPCISTERGVTFATRPRSDFQKCEKSMCDPEYYFDEWSDWCLDEAGYDPANATCP